MKTIAEMTAHGQLFYHIGITLFETLIPPLTGFQFNRTLYFNTFLWYALLFLVLKRL